ncbi:hypothetical protein [Actinomadura sp. 6N118]|uniref:hypothetical protein n=1 Tax=Actinomadura sp. 6N118 TaxID=3375151 RepID=UPI0037A9BACB
MLVASPASDDVRQWIQAVGTALVGLIGLWFANNYRRQLRVRLSDRRIQAYARLWEPTVIATPMRSERPLTKADREQLFDLLTSWYYGHGDGMLLTARTRELYLKVKTNLICDDADLQPAMLATLVRSAPADRVNAQRGCISVRQLSLLRTQLKADLAVYGVPFYGPLLPDERELLRSCRIRTWRHRLRPRLRRSPRGRCSCGRCMAPAEQTSRSPQQGDHQMFWPWGNRSAILAVPALLIVLLPALALTRSTLDWPSDDLEGRVLLGIVIIALLPLILLLVGSLTTGGSLETLGVRIEFPEAEQTRSEFKVSPQMGLQPGTPISDSSTVQILQTLRDAAGNEVAVIDIGDGTSWWETRLLVLCAGAVRLGRPRAVVFLARDAEIGNGAFRGWAPPDELADALLGARADLQAVHDEAKAISRQWALALPLAPDGPAELPFPSQRGGQYRHVIFSGAGTRRARFAPEQVLAAELGRPETTDRHGLLTSTRLNEIFDPVLRRRSIDLDTETGSANQWARTVLSSTAPLRRAHPKWPLRGASVSGTSDQQHPPRRGRPAHQ